jgi:integrase
VHLALAEARARTPEVLRTLATGRTPRQVKDERRRAEEALVRDTFAAVAEDFVREHLPRLRHARPAEALIRGTLIEAWGPRPASRITRSDVVALVKGVARGRGRYAAHHVYAQVSKMFNWMLANDRGGLDFNPAAAVRITDVIGPAKRRTRVLSDRELKVVWTATGPLDYPFGPLYRLLILTGCRLNELAKARWSDIQGDALVLPDERVKVDQPHSVPLTAAVRAILDGLPRQGKLIFTTNGLTPVSGFSRAKRRLDHRVAQSSDEPIPDFDVHDFRRTVRTGLSSLGVPNEVAELVIGHKRQGVEAVYDLHRFDAEKRAALEAWSQKLMSIVGAA